MPPRPRVELTDNWHQIEFLARAPGQRTREFIRPVVLLGQSRTQDLGALLIVFYMAIRQHGAPGGW